MKQAIGFLLLSLGAVNGWVMRSPTVVRGSRYTASPSFLDRTLCARSAEPDDCDKMENGEEKAEYMKDLNQIPELKRKLKDAQEKGDTMEIVTIMGTLFALQGAYDDEVEDDGALGQGQNRVK